MLLMVYVTKGGIDQMESMRGGTIMQHKIKGDHQKLIHERGITDRWGQSKRKEKENEEIFFSRRKESSGSS